MMSAAAEMLDYVHPETQQRRGRAFYIVSLIFTVLTGYSTYTACRAVYYSHQMPGHYFPLLAFSYAFWLVLLGAGIGAGFAIAGLRQKDRGRRIAKWSLCINVLYLVVITILAVLTKGGTESA